MRDERHCGEQSGQCEAIADFLHCYASRTESWSSDERTTEIVHDSTDGDVRDRDNGLAYDQ